MNLGTESPTVKVVVQTDEELRLPKPIFKNRFVKVK